MSDQFASPPVTSPVDDARTGTRAAGRRTLVLVAVGGAVVLAATAVASAALFGPEPAGTGDVAAPAPTGVTPTAVTTGAGTATTATTGAATGGSDGVDLGRNVFDALVDHGGASAGADGVVTPDASAPAVPSVVTPVTVTVPGPTVTNYALVTQTAAGPTVTVVSTDTVSSTAPGAGFDFTMEVTAVADADTDDSDATVTVNDDDEVVAVGDAFGPGGVLTYVGYDATAGVVTITLDEFSFTLPVGRTVAFDQ